MDNIMLKILRTNTEEIVINITHVDYIQAYKNGCLIKFNGGEWQSIPHLSVEEAFKQLQTKRAPR
jgi:hypothetical protein